MSDYINNNFHSLKEFTDLAEASGDNQELRIRKSNHELSNTPLGFIARNFGKTHTNSNIQANKSFKNALVTNNKYRAISQQLSHSLSVSMPDNRALTPVTIRAAIRTADRMLSAKQDAFTLMGMAVDFKVIPQSQAEEFNSFVNTYLIENEDMHLDLTGCGDRYSLTDEQQNLSQEEIEKLVKKKDDQKAENFSKIIQAFYKQDNCRRFNAECGFGLTTEAVDGDLEKTRLCNEIIRKAQKSRGSIESTIRDVFKVKKDNIPERGPIAKVFSNSVANFFTLHYKNVLFDNNQKFSLRILDSDTLNRISNSLNNYRNTEKGYNLLKSIKVLLDDFTKKHPAFKNPTPQMQHELGELVNSLLAVPANKASSKIAEQLSADYSIRRQLNNTENLKIDDQIIFEKAGVSPEIGKKFITLPEFHSRFTAKVEELKNADFTEEEYENAVTEEAYKIINDYKDMLGKVGNSNIDPALHNVILKSGLSFLEIMKHMSKEHFDQNSFLNSIKTLYENLNNNNPKLSDAQLGTVIKDLTTHFFAELDENERILLCQKNKDTLSNLVGQLNVLAADKSISAPTASLLREIGTLTQAVFSNFVMTLSENKQENLFLQPVVSAEVNEQLRQNVIEAQNGRRINRNALPSQIFMAEQEYRKDNVKPKVIDYLHKLTCTDRKILSSLVDNNTGSSVLAGKLGAFTGKDAPSYYHILLDIKNLGNVLVKLIEANPNVNKDDLVKLISDAFISDTENEKLNTLLELVKTGKVKELLEVLNYYAKEDAKLTDNQPQSPVLDVINGIKLLTQISKSSAEKLGQELPKPLFDTNSTKTLFDIPYEGGNFPDQISGIFKRYCTLADYPLYESNLSTAQIKNVKTFFSQLNLPSEDGEPMTMSSYEKSKSYKFNYTDENGKNIALEWTTQMFGTFMGFKAKEVSDLLESTNNHPAASQLWEAMHGGNAPAGLTMDNFVQTFSETLSKEINIYAKLIGKSPEQAQKEGVIPITPDNFTDVCLKQVGVSPLDVISKMQNALHNDITFTVEDQRLKNGAFSINKDAGKMYNSAEKDNYGFSIDFYRAEMPEGSKDTGNKEGCKIVVNKPEGQTVSFTTQEYKQREENGHDPKEYINSIVNEIRKLPANDEQLGAVGYLTGQSIQGLLRCHPFFYKKCVSSLEHTALDHVITKLDNGAIQVKVREKPGTLVKFYMEFIVSENGEISIPNSKIVLPSLDKISEYNRTHNVQH